MLQKINEVDKEERTDLITKARSRDIASYNEKNPNNKMKRLIVIIDEYADLIQTAEMQGNRKKFEKKGYITCRKEKSPLGPIRKYYSVTETGRIYLEGFRESYQRVTASADEILGGNLK